MDRFAVGQFKDTGQLESDIKKYLQDKKYDKLSIAMANVLEVEKRGN